MQGMPSLNGKQNRIQKRIGVVQGIQAGAPGMLVKALGMLVNLWGFKTLAQHHPKEQSANSFGPVVKKPDLGCQTAFIGQSGKTKCGVPNSAYRAIRKVPVAVRLPSR
jgi:hypothetical protein